MESEERISGEQAEVKVEGKHTETQGEEACEKSQNVNGENGEQQQHAEQNTDTVVGKTNGQTDEESEPSSDLLNQLENVDLTDEDTELLLEEAYAMNKKLKEILRQQENKDAARHSSLRHSLPTASRSAGSRHAVLPPIKGGNMSKQHDIYSARMSRPGPPHGRSTSPGKNTSQSPTRISPSALHKGHKERPKPQRSARSGGDKPGWNNRFSYNI